MDSQQRHRQELHDALDGLSADAAAELGLLATQEVFRATSPILAAWIRDSLFAKIKGQAFDGLDLALLSDGELLDVLGGVYCLLNSTTHATIHELAMLAFKLAVVRLQFRKLEPSLN